MQLKTGQLHVRVQECNNFLITVTSRLDAVVACINVLHPMEISDALHSNLCCGKSIWNMFIL